MAVVIRAIQSIQLPNNPGDFTLELIEKAVFLGEDSESPGNMLVLVETGSTVTATRSFALLEKGGLIPDERGSRLKFLGLIIGGQVPRFLFERVVP